MVDLSKIPIHADVVGSDGQHVGTVDNVGIKLTKSDPSAHDQHHYLKADLVASVDGDKVVLNVPAAQAHADLKAVEN